MKAKLLLVLFFVSLGLGAFASEHPKKVPHAHCKARDKVMTRTPFDPSIQAEDINNCLYLTFQFSLDAADIIIKDKNDNEVVNELQTLIYEGCVINIPQSDAYPYSIEIISPVVAIQGEIILE